MNCRQDVRRLTAGPRKWGNSTERCAKDSANTHAKSILCSLGLAFLLTFAVHVADAGGDYRTEISKCVQKMITDKIKSVTISVAEPFDLTPEKAYYPFMKNVKTAIENALMTAGVAIRRDASAYFRTAFTIRDNGLTLNFEIERSSDQRKLASDSLDIPASALPKPWPPIRKMKDVAHELVDKLARRTFTSSNITLVFSDLSGGRTKEQGLVSDFSKAMSGYIREELSRAPRYTLICASDKNSLDASVFELRGQYDVLSAQINIYLKLLGGQDRREENVSSKLLRASLPDGMELFPQNEATAASGVDTETEKEAYKPDVKVAVWTKEDQRVFHDGDALKVFIRPAEDCHARVYYIQSDGIIWQIFPSSDSESAFLRGERTICIGGEQDDVDLTINDKTIGQEFIKVFAARHKIDDSLLPKKYIQGVGYQMRGGYDTLKSGIGFIRFKGLDMKQKVLPVAEIKIRVDKKR